LGASSFSVGSAAMRRSRMQYWKKRLRLDTRRAALEARLAEHFGPD